MADNKESTRVKEAKYVIIIPILITIICALLDIISNINAGAYDNFMYNFNNTEIIGSYIAEGMTEGQNVLTVGILSANKADYFLNIVRCAMGYLFPSLISCVIAMIWQQVSLEEKPYGIAENRVFHSIIATVIYSFIFIIGLIAYNVVTAVLMCITSLIYSVYIYKECLDKRILSKQKDEKTEEELLTEFVNKNENEKG